MNRGPGRIYLNKKLFEEQANEGLCPLHLDRCLTCRAGKDLPIWGQFW
ncbi:MAG: hypothetical protein CM15mP68_0010 [Pseudomonadota bacterium]|nr:MAG: hypothetical protein CM15mP68_0010 [Pseudomonadota bacterium]